MRTRTRLSVESLETREVLSTYFVAVGGSNGNAGTDQSPWATLQYAAGRVQAGDTVVVRAGTYTGFDLRTDGTASNPIQFLADPGVVINARNSITPDGINLEGADYIVIDGFEVAGIERTGIRSVLNHHVTIRDNYLHHNGKWGILTGFSDDLLIENNICTYSVAEHGIYVSNSGDRPVIRNNVCAFNNANGIHMNGDVSLGGDGIISGALVEGNTIYENGVAGGSGINCDGVQNSIIQNNLLYDNHASGISLYRIDGGGGSSGNRVVNNTVIVAANGRWALNIQGGSTNNTVRNNILYTYHSFRGSIDISADSLSGFTSDYNVVMQRFTTNGGSSVMTLAQWQAATGQDMHSIVATPAALFVNVAGDNYHLSDTSPAINAGTSAFAPLKDIEGNTRPSGGFWDIGAYERSSTAVNTPPVANDDSASTAAGTPVAVNVLANDSDADGDALAVSLQSGPANGQAVVGADKRITYTPNAGFAGSDSFVYQVSDGRGGFDTATVNVTVTPPANTPPVANDDSTSTAAGTPVAINVLANDSDADGDALAVSLQSGPANGQAVVGADKRITYTPNAGFTGSDSFVYQVSDGRGGFDTATVNVTVTGQPENTVGLEADPWNPGKQALVVRGTSTGDTISFTSASSGTRVAVTVNGVSRGSFLLSSISRIIAFGRAGNDSITVANGLRVDAQLWGEDGNDTLLGGGGNDLLLGGLGDDRLEGRHGRNILVGGEGADRLIGAGNAGSFSDGSDLLIGGLLSHQGDDAALKQIAQEWTSTRTYAERTSRLNSGADGLARLDSTTVLDDGAVDTLTGGKGLDWFWANLPQDVLTDRKSTERIN